MTIGSCAALIQRETLILAFVNMQVVLTFWDVRRMVNNRIRAAYRLAAMLRLK